MRSRNWSCELSLTPINEHACRDPDHRNGIGADRASRRSGPAGGVGECKVIHPGALDAKLLIEQAGLGQLAITTCATHSASWLTRPANTFGNAAAAGTIRERTGAYALACTTAAVNRR